MGDRRKCQTYAASPAEPGGLPLMLGGRGSIGDSEGLATFTRSGEHLVVGGLPQVISTSFQLTQ